MNNKIVAIISFMAGSVFIELINMFFAPFKNWAFNKTKDSCKFIFPYEPLTGIYHDIEITKRFGKTIQINCPWFRKREIKRRKDKSYLHCPFGGNDGKGGICPFC